MENNKPSDDDDAGDCLSNYTIPKKAQPLEEGELVEPSSVLPADTETRTGYRQQPQNLGLTTSYNHIQGSTNTYLQSQKRKLESTAVGMTYKESQQEWHDSTLPAELSALFQPLFCKLCSLQLTSPVVAKLHYKGKNHDKKVRKFLVDYAVRTGEPLHKRARKGPNVQKEQDPDDNDPKYFRCDVCDLPLTGRMHAESHYMGKNHHSVLAGRKAPAGKGYYNPDGKWIRLPTAKTDAREDGFGLDFVAPEKPRPSSDTPTVGSSSLRCDLCKVSVTSSQQMEMHQNGQRHKKRLRQLGMPEEPEQCAAKESLKTLSVYKTPTGDFYCQTCNLVLNSEVQFGQHLQSKKHYKKLSTGKE